MTSTINKTAVIKTILAATLAPVAVVSTVSTAAGPAATIAVEAVTDDAHPVTGIEALSGQGQAVAVYNLDDGERLTAELARGLPPDQEAAKAALQRRFAEQGRAAVQQRFERAFQGRIAAFEYGLTRYPAVVFNHGQAVVYGVTDLPQALTLYRQWAGQGEGKP